jgi:hypothetical protein
MACKACQSVNQREFPAEISIHFPHMRSLDKSSVWAFPTLLVCLDCGLAEFILLNAELSMLAKAIAA